MPGSNGSIPEKSGFHIYPYLDDQLVKANSKQKCYRNM